MATAEGDQARLLAKAKETVTKKAFEMKQSIDKNQLDESIQRCQEMLSELKTVLLTPKIYYELYMIICDEMRHIREYFGEVHRRGMKCVKLYEKVQNVTEVLPRLYLMATAASVLIESQEVPAKEVLKDVADMTKGVQHPMRGLFLRNYLSDVTKDKLPDVGTKYEGEGGDVNDAIDFLLQVFSETNRLWVRMQHQTVIRDKKRREAERKDLKLLVGKGLLRLTQLDGLNLNIYREAVLPRVLDTITSTKDKMAQYYLMDCFISVFPGEYHMHCLKQTVDVFSSLNPALELDSLLVMLIEKLVEQNESNPTTDVDAFDIINNQISSMIEEQKGICELPKVLKVNTTLLDFIQRTCPERIDYIDHCFRLCFGMLSQEKKNPDHQGFAEDIIEMISELLMAPLASLAMEVLQLDHFPKLLDFVPSKGRRAIALKLLKSFLAGKSVVEDPESVDRLLFFMSPLIKEAGDGDAISPEDLESEQVVVAKLVQTFQNSDTDVLFEMYNTARKHFGRGSTRNLKYTLTPLLFGSFRLAERVSKAELEGKEVRFKAKKVLVFAHEIVTALTSYCPELAFQMWLQCVSLADRCNYPVIAYEFMTQAFVVYEEELAGDSKEQRASLLAIIGTVLSCKNLEKEDFEGLRIRVSNCTAKLLKKIDQCRMATYCAHLFWNVQNEAPKEDDGEVKEESVIAAGNSNLRDAKSVLDCLKRALKVAERCTPSAHAQLYTEILDKYLYFFEAGNELIPPANIGTLKALIDKHMDSAEGGKEKIEAHLNNTLKHIQFKKDEEGFAERFAAIQI